MTKVVTAPATYPIGIAGVPWQQAEKTQWLNKQVKKRSYQDDVVSQLVHLNSEFEQIQYGALSINPALYPLFALKTKHWDRNKPIMLVTGGVHGYETSGVQGAIQFIKNINQSDYIGPDHKNTCNIVVLPCISPWAYEHIVRWNPYTVDPNRSFIANSPSQEASNAMQFIESLDGKVLLHIDLHETTDSDETEFRPALSARDGETFIADIVPDGFYLVGNSKNKQTLFQQSIIDAVGQITHIAPADDQGNIIGAKAEKTGLIYYSVKALGLCASMTDANYTTTTEVYPDSKTITAQDCNNAQVTAIKAAFDYVLNE